MSGRGLEVSGSSGDFVIGGADSEGSEANPYYKTRYSTKLFQKYLPAFATFLLAATAFLLPLNAVRPVEGITYGDLALLSTVMASLVLCLLSRRLPNAPRLFWSGVVLLLAGGAISFLFPPQDVVAVERVFAWLTNESSAQWFAKLILALVLFPLAVMVLVSRREVISILVSFWIAGVSLSALVAVIDAYVGTSIQAELSFGDAANGFMSIDPPRFSGLTVHPIFLGLTCAISLPLVFARMNDLRSLAMYSPVVGLFLLCVLLSGSRAGLLAALVGIGLSLVWIRSLRKTVFSRDFRPGLILVLGLVGALMAAFLVAPAARGLDEDAVVSSSAERFAPGEASASQSNQERLAFMEKSVEFIINRPISGYGFQWLTASHNIYLQLLLSGGVMTLIGYILVMGTYIKIGSLMRASKPQKDQDMIRALIIGVILVLVNGVIASPVSDRFLYFPCALLLAMWSLHFASPDRFGLQVRGRSLLGSR